MSYEFQPEAPQALENTGRQAYQTGDLMSNRQSSSSNNDSSSWQQSAAQRTEQNYLPRLELTGNYSGTTGNGGQDVSNTFGTTNENTVREWPRGLPVPGTESKASAETSRTQGFGGKQVSGDLRGNVFRPTPNQQTPGNEAGFGGKQFGGDIRSNVFRPTANTQNPILFDSDTSGIARRNEQLAKGDKDKGSAERSVPQTSTSGEINRNSADRIYMAPPTDGNTETPRDRRDEPQTPPNSDGTPRVPGPKTGQDAPRQTGNQSDNGSGQAPGNDSNLQNRANDNNGRERGNENGESSVTNPDGSVSRFDQNGRIRSVNYPDGRSRHFAYDENGQLNGIMQMDSQGNVTSMLTKEGHHWYRLDQNSNRRVVLPTHGGNPVIGRDGNITFLTFGYGPHTRSFHRYSMG